MNLYISRMHLPQGICWPRPEFDRRIVKTNWPNLAYLIVLAWIIVFNREEIT